MCGIEVPVPVEADVGRFAGVDDADQGGRERMRRQRQEAGLLLGQRVPYGARGIAGDPSGVGHRVAPGDELPVQILDVAERPGGEERVPQVADGPLYTALLMGRPDRTGAGDEVVMAAQFQEPRVEADGLPLPFEDRTFQVVVRHDPGHPMEGGKGFDMAAEKTLERLVECEHGVQGPRPAEHEDEGRQPPGGAPHPHGPEAPPIGLPLLPREQVQP